LLIKYIKFSFTLTDKIHQKRAFAFADKNTLKTLVADKIHYVVAEDDLRREAGYSDAAR